MRHASKTMKSAERVTSFQQVILASGVQPACDRFGEAGVASRPDRRRVARTAVPSTSECHVENAECGKLRALLFFTRGRAHVIITQPDFNCLVLLGYFFRANSAGPAT